MVARKSQRSQDGCSMARDVQCGELGRLDKDDRWSARPTIVHVFCVTDCFVRNVAPRILDYPSVYWTRQYRIFGDPGERLASKMVLATRGTMNGTIVVALSEGLLDRNRLWCRWRSNAVLFTFLTIAFAMLPFGAWAAFTAAAATLLVPAGGSSWAAVAVFGWGAAIMLIGDHFVWPALVGGAARLPFLFALVGVFGGLALFGLVALSGTSLDGRAIDGLA